MHDAPPFGILIFSTIVADVIVGLMGFALCGGLAFFAHSMAQIKLAQLAPGDAEELTGPVALILALVSFLFWPCALVLAIIFMMKPATARTGRLCAFGGIAYLALSFVLGIVIGDAIILSGVLVL